MKLGRVESKRELTDILSKNNIDYAFVKYVRDDNKEDIVYMVSFERGKFYSENICCYKAYNNDKTLSPKEIEGMVEETGCINLFNDGVLYEFDAYCIYEDFVKYPIRDVELISEEEALKWMVKNK